MRPNFLSYRNRLMFNKYHKAYQAQKSSARSRRIEWNLTFREWREWWGTDIDNRGRGADQLQMQRFNDSGPYALWNISKGTPAQNVATADEQRKIKRQALIDNGYTWEPCRSPTPPAISINVDIHGNAIEPEEEMEESWQGAQEYGRAKPLGQWI